MPAGTGGEPRLALSGVRQDERLAFEVIWGTKERLSDVSVEFEITDLGGTTPLLHSPAFLSPGTRRDLLLAQGVSIMRGLPPGEYEVRAKVSSGGETVGDVRRGFTILEGRRADVKAGEAAAPASRDVAVLHTNASRMPVLTVQPFALDQVLAPPILGPFLERVAARPDSSAPAGQGLLERARSSGVSGLSIPDAVVTAAPAGAFLKGLTLLSENKLEPAAAAFRDAIRLAPDFYPAMVYLGACYAAGGKDKEAAAAWRTALIREGDAPELHAMLADAWLRQGRGDLAVADLRRIARALAGGHGVEAALRGGRAARRPGTGRTPGPRRAARQQDRGRARPGARSADVLRSVRERRPDRERRLRSGAGAASR